MSKEKTISNWQLKTMLFMFILGTYIIVGGATAGRAGKDLWIALTLAASIAIGFFFVLAALQKRFPGKDLADYNTIVFGKFIGTFINIIYLVYFIFLEILVYGNLIFLFTDLFFEQTPNWAIASAMNFLTVIINLSGLETIAGMSELTSPIMLILIAVTTFFALISPGVDLGNLFPLGASGLIPILEATRNNLSFPMGELIVFAMFFHRIEKPKNLRNDLIKGTVFAVSILLITIIRNILVFGGTLEIFSFPSAMVVRHIEVGGFIERVEPIIVIGWFFSIFLKASILLYASVAMASKITGVKSKLYLIIPIIAIGHTVGPTLLGTEFIIRFINDYVYPWMFVLQMGVPVLLLLIARVRGLGANGKKQAIL